MRGGSVAFDAAAEQFVSAAGGAQAATGLLLQGGHDWQEYVPDYVEPWIRRGVTRYYPIVPREDGTLNLDAAAAPSAQPRHLRWRGPHTDLPPPVRRGASRHLLGEAMEPIRSIIRDRYEQGVPYAGVSAGTLVAPQICAIPPEDTGEPAVQVLPGLDLIRDVIVGVHFTEWNALPHVLEAMSQTQTAKAWGIDEDTCALFEDGQFKRSLGGSVYEIRMTDSRTQTYQITEHRAPG